MKIVHTAISVRDLETSVAFYRDVLGLSERFRTFYEGFNADLVFMADEEGGAEIELVYYHDPVKQAEAVRIGNVLVHIGILIKDMDAEVDRMRAQGAGFIALPKRLNGTTLAFLRDPDGVVIELICRDTA